MMGKELLSDNSLKTVQNAPRLQETPTDRASTLASLIKKPRHKNEIVEAIETEKRIRLHTVGKQDYSTSFDSFLDDFVKNLLPAPKFEVFKSLISQPVPTLTLSETIFDELAKIFQASNPSRKLTFKDDSPKKTNEFNNYFNLDRFFRNEVFDTLKTAPNSFIVVDTKNELLNGKPQAVPYFVNLEAIIDVSVNRDGSTEYILFRASNDTIIGIDDEAYYVFEKIDSSSDYQLKAGFPSKHNLADRLGRPYTPAFLIYPDFLNVTDNIAVNSPLTKNLGNLEWLLFWAISKRHLDLYAPFPIYVSFEEECTYKDPSTGAECHDGYLYNTSEGAEESSTAIRCPSCSKKKMFGAGTEVEVPAPQSREEPNLIDAINVIPAEKESIKYVTEEKIRLEQEIYYSVLGKTSQPLETFSQSVAQLDLSTESRKAVLLEMKEIFESVHSKVLYTMCKLIYGEEFIDCYVNYGDNYFLTTAEQETTNYKSLKDAGAPEGMLHSNLERIIATTYKTSPSTALLNQVYLEVEPYQTMSVEAVTKLLATNNVPRKKALAKIHFTDFIEEFEAEHEALVKMAELGEASKSVLVKQIKKQLDQYIEQIIKDIDKDIERTMEIEEDKMERQEAIQNKNNTAPDIAKPSSVAKRTMPYRADDDSSDD